MRMLIIFTSSLFVHTGEKPYKCQIEGCNRSFPQLSNLQHHYRNHDKPEPPSDRKCIFCDRTYCSEVVLRNHVLKVCCFIGLLLQWSFLLWNLLDLLKVLSTTHTCTSTHTRRIVVVALSKETFKSKEGNDQESIQSIRHHTRNTIREVTKTQGNITYKRAKRSALSQRVTTNATPDSR